MAYKTYTAVVALSLGYNSAFSYLSAFEDNRGRLDMASRFEKLAAELGIDIPGPTCDILEEESDDL